MDLFKKTVDEIKSSGLPTVLYGAGVLASRVERFFAENGIEIAGYSVDEKYYSSAKAPTGKPVYSLDKYIAQNRCNVVVAFVGLTEERENELRSVENVNLYVCDFSAKYNLSDCDTQMTDEFYEKNKAVLDKLVSDMSDEESKIQLEEFINQKRTGIYRKRHAKNPQYFDDDVMRLSEGEVFVDCGAYDGDTILAFMASLEKHNISSYGKIYAFEADEANTVKMRENLKGKPNIEILSKGVFDHTGTLCFEAGNQTSSKISSDGIKIEITTIDEVVGDDNVTLIKMDIEGSELAALKGAEKTIKRCKPKLAICVYHKTEDLVTIPQYIQSLHPDYKLSFRNYDNAALESVLYAE